MVMFQFMHKAARAALIPAAVCLLAGVAAPAVAQDNAPAAAEVAPAAQTLMDRVDAAWGELDGISYQFRGYASGFPGVADSLPVATGEVWIVPGLGDKGVQRVVGQMPDDEAERAFDIVLRRDAATWIDHESETVFSGTRRAGATGTRANSLGLLDNLKLLLETSPMAAQAGEASRVAVGPETTIGGEKCRTLVFTVPRGRTEAQIIWAIGPDDLPRRVSQNQTLALTTDLSRPEVGRTFGPRAFDIAPPAGYSVSRAGEPGAAPRAQRPGTQDRVGPSGVTSAPEALAPGDRPLAPTFELKTPEGEVVRLAELRGRVVVLDFWGTWCLPCKLSSPEVQKLHEDYEDEPVTVLGLAVRERDLSKPREYMDDNGYTYTILLEADDVAKAYRIRAYPSFVVIGPDGSLVHRAQGFHPENNNPFQEIRDAINEQLGQIR